MKVCYFGDYNPDYPRHHVLIKGLRLNGVEVVEKNTNKDGIHKYISLIRILYSVKDSVDIILVAYTDSRYVWLVKMLTKKPVVWNAFYSKYENWIFDRKLASPFSFKALFYWFSDFICSIAADLIILETDADINYFVHTFKINRNKFIRILVGYNDDYFHPLDIKKTTDKFIIEFHGKYIPIQGIEYIIEAAKILEDSKDIIFHLIGSGQEYKKIRSMVESWNLENILFIPRMPLYELPRYIAEADVCLGLFGNIDRVEQAIPNKIYEASAMRKPSININSEAIHELFVDRESILLCKKGDAYDLANKILEIKQDNDLRKRIAQGAYDVVSKKANTKTLGRILRDVLSQRYM